MKELRTFEILVKDAKLKKKILDYIYKYGHFENILLILIRENYIKNHPFKNVILLKLKVTAIAMRLLQNSKSSKSVVFTTKSVAVCSAL